MKVDTADIKQIVAEATQLGYMQAVKSYEPTQDNIRAGEVKKWLHFNNLDPRALRIFQKEGLVNPRRQGSGKNSPLIYSKEEIRKAYNIRSVAALFQKNS